MSLKHTRTTGALVGLCLILCGGPAHSGDPFQTASKRIMAGDYQAALEEYEAFLDEHPRDRLAPVAAMGAANILYLALEDQERAIRAYDRVLADYRDSAAAAEAARRKAECIEAGEDWAAAGEAYNLALELAGRAALDETDAESPDWISAVSLAAANCYHQLGDHQKVIATYERVLSGTLPPEANATALFNLAASHEAGNESAKAATHYARLITDHPWAQEFPQALQKRELIAQHVQLDWEAYAAFAAAIEANRRRDFAAATEHCDRVLAQGGSAALHSCARYRKILCESIGEGDLTSGNRRLRELVGAEPVARLMPNSEATLGFLARGAAAEAQVERNPDNVPALLNLGTIYRQASANAKAVETFERVRELAPENNQVHLNLGFAYAAQGRNADAAEAFETYLREDPQNTAVLNQIGYTYLGLGDPEQAITYFRRYAALAPDEANAHDSLGEGLLRAGRLEEAAQEYERAVAIDPGFFNSYFMLGDVYRQLGDAGKAATALQRFLELVSSGPQADQARAMLAEMGSE